MEFIPIIFLKNRKIYTGIDHDPLSIEKFEQTIKPDTLVYFYDEDGINNDKPNLCLIPKLSKHADLWVDTGPRDFGAVVDILMAGASHITLRQNLWSKIDISHVREITENNIYLTIDPDINLLSYTDMSLYTTTNGCVMFHTKHDIEEDIQSGSNLKNISSKFQVYALEFDPGNISYWAKKGMKGLFIPIQKGKEFTKSWEMKKKLLSDFYSNEAAKSD